MKKSMLIGAIIFGVIVVGGIIVGVSLGNSNTDDVEIGTNTNTNTSISNEKESDSYNMEKVQAGKYSFLVPNNGNKKYANGDSQQTFYSEDGQDGMVWYSLEGPLEPAKDKNSAHNITRSGGRVIEFKYDKSKGVEQCYIINEYKGEYQGLRIVTNSNDSNDCIWFEVLSYDKKLLEKILDSLEW